MPTPHVDEADAALSTFGVSVTKPSTFREILTRLVLNRQLSPAATRWPVLNRPLVAKGGGAWY
jgi:hypothetical protein